MSEVIYRKYRARNFAELQSQDVIVQVITQAFKQDKASHAYLFTGPRGTGKTSMARLVAKAANCVNFSKNADVCNECSACLAIEAGTYMDLIEIDAASNRGIDEIRQIRENVNFLPSEGKFKIYIIDEVHMLTREAFNALLKTLEEPPSHIIFVLATTEPQKVPATILSRVQRFDFRLATESELSKKVIRILHDENLEISQDALNLIYRYSEGSYRDAESLLSKVLVGGVTNTAITGTIVSELLGIADQGLVESMLSSMLEKNAQKAFQILDKLQMGGINLDQFIKQLIELLRDHVTEKIYSASSYFSEVKMMGKILSLYNEYRYIGDTKLLLEMLVLEICAGGGEVNADEGNLREGGKRKGEREKEREANTKKGKEQKNTTPKTEVKSQLKHAVKEGKTDKTGKSSVEKKWKQVIKRSKELGPIFQMHMRQCACELDKEVLTIICPYPTIASDLSADEITKKLVKLIKSEIHAVNEIIIKVNDNYQLTEEEEEEDRLLSLGSNAHVVEALI